MRAQYQDFWDRGRHKPFLLSHFWVIEFYSSRTQTSITRVGAYRSDEETLKNEAQLFIGGILKPIVKSENPSISTRSLETFYQNYGIAQYIVNLVTLGYERKQLLTKKCTMVAEMLDGVDACNFSATRQASLLQTTTDASAATDMEDVLKIIRQEKFLRQAFAFAVDHRQVEGLMVFVPLAASMNLFELALGDCKIVEICRAIVRQCYGTLGKLSHFGQARIWLERHIFKRWLPSFSLLQEERTGGKDGGWVKASLPLEKTKLTAPPLPPIQRPTSLKVVNAVNIGSPEVPGSETSRTAFLPIQAGGAAVFLPGVVSESVNLEGANTSLPPPVPPVIGRRSPPPPPVVRRPLSLSLTDTSPPAEEEDTAASANPSPSLRGVQESPLPVVNVGDDSLTLSQTEGDEPVAGSEGDGNRTISSPTESDETPVGLESEREDATTNPIDTGEDLSPRTRTSTQALETLTPIPEEEDAESDSDADSTAGLVDDCSE